MQTRKKEALQSPTPKTEASLAGKTTARLDMANPLEKGASYQSNSAKHWPMFFGLYFSGAKEYILAAPCNAQGPRYHPSTMYPPALAPIPITGAAVGRLCLSSQDCLL